MPNAILVSMKIFQRLYVDNQLTRTSRPKDLATARQWLANMEENWREHMMPDFVLAPGAFDPNQAVSVSRVSDDELAILTTGGKALRVINVIKDTK